MKIYTRRGDEGYSSLYGGGKLSKAHELIESYGTIDELNSFIGFLRDTLSWKDCDPLLSSIQNQLFSLGANLATEHDTSWPCPVILEEDILQLEQAIDEMESNLPPLKNFILPAGHPNVSTCHVCRTICRRAERTVVRVLHQHNHKVDPKLIPYLNRLSDYFFVLARIIAMRLNAKEEIWKNG